MTVNGIIAEYNPFHNGHLYQLLKSKEMTGADYTIVVMSGSFTQRGEPAVIDKYTRAKMALCEGVDLVLELPISYATSSAEGFAHGSVEILSRLGVVNHLCFGSECGDINILKDIATLLLNEPEAFKEKLSAKIKAGFSYPAARQQAISEYFNDSSYTECLSLPNNILGIEYLKALQQLNSPIIPVTLSRQGTGYHDLGGKGNIASAGAIRLLLENNGDIDCVSNYIPPTSKHILEEYLKTYSPVFQNDLSGILYYKLLSQKDVGYSSYLDINEDLSNRIAGFLYSYTDYMQFCKLLDSKNLTFARINRCLNHILLETTLLPPINYVRVLGFRKDAAPLLSAIKQNTTLPLIIKMANAKNILLEENYSFFLKDVFANDIYEGVLAQKSKQLPRNEFQMPILLL